jgi:hypothetical protein
MDGWVGGWMDGVLEPFVGNMAHILQWHISTNYSVFFMLSGFAIGHPGQRRVPQLVHIDIDDTQITALFSVL